MNKIKVGISVGDINGISLEIILKTFLDNRIIDFCIPIIFVSKKILVEYVKKLDFKNIHWHVINNITEAHSRKINIMNIEEKDITLNIGNPSSISAKHALKSIKEACSALQKNHLDVLVTAPINKYSIQNIEKKFIGHTEFLANTFKGKSLMIMVSESLKIACLTGHIALSDVIKNITCENITTKTILLHDSLKQDFGFIRPKIAILGLNPHAGENGMLGKEEKEIIEPTIKKLKSKGILVFGPYSADSFFSERNIKIFDGVLAMYHDQGLIPFKTIAFNEGVNYTAGLNVIRTSPVHGTAFEIAGKGIANEQSFRQAIFLSCEIYKKRKEYSLLTNNSLYNKNED